MRICPIINLRYHLCNFGKYVRFFLLFTFFWKHELIYFWTKLNWKRNSVSTTQMILNKYLFYAISSVFIANENDSSFGSLFCISTKNTQAISSSRVLFAISLIQACDNWISLVVGVSTMGRRDTDSTSNRGEEREEMTISGIVTERVGWGWRENKAILI